MQSLSKDPKSKMVVNLGQKNIRKANFKTLAGENGGN